MRPPTDFLGPRGEVADLRREMKGTNESVCAIRPMSRTARLAWRELAHLVEEERAGASLLGAASGAQRADEPSRRLAEAPHHVLADLLLPAGRQLRFGIVRGAPRHLGGTRQGREWRGVQ